MKFSTQKKSSLFILLAAFVYTQTALAKVNIFACEPEWQSLSQELGGELVNSFSATTGLQDPHHIQARPGLIVKIRNADMIACTGADLEIGWLPLLIRRAGNLKIQKGQPGYFMASNHVRLLGIPKIVDRSQGDVHAAGNPHIQTSPKNILPVARALTERLIQIDPANKAQYQHKLTDFSQRWKAALARWKKLTRPLKHQIVFVHHDNWVYLEDYLKLEQTATLEDKPGIPPTSGHLSELLKQTKQQMPAMIIRAAYQSGKPAQWLSSRTGIPAVTLPFTVGGTAQSTDLFSLYDDTFARLLKVIQP